MTQQNKDNQKQEGLSRVKTNGSAWSRFFAKRWTYPAVYLGAAALIIGLMYTKTHSIALPQKDTSGNGTQTSQGTSQSPSTQETASSQSVIWPIGQDGAAVKVTQNFFNSSDGSDRQSTELVKYDNRFYPQNGIVMGLSNDSPFTVVAAASGTVTSVANDPLMGKVVTIKDDDSKYITYYASLQNVTVKVGDKVLQDQEIGKSGNNLFEATQKNHLHFEMQDLSGKFLNPVTYLPPREDSVAPVSTKATGDTSSAATTDSTNSVPGTAASTNSTTGSSANSTTSTTNSTTGTTNSATSSANSTSGN